MTAVAAIVAMPIKVKLRSDNNSVKLSANGIAQGRGEPCDHADASAPLLVRERSVGTAHWRTSGPCSGMPDESSELVGIAAMAATARALWASARSQAAGNCAFQGSILRSWLCGQRAGHASVAIKRVFPASQGQLKDVEVKVTNFNSEDKGLATIAGDVFDVPIRPDIIHRVVRWQLAKRRQGNASTKGIREVSGTGRKPGPQKGSGRARHGSLRGPQFRGGATQHGPKPRSHEIGLQKQVRRLGLKVALSARIAEGKLKVFDSVVSPTLKTREMERLVAGMEGCKKVLFVDDAEIVNEPLCRSTANLHYINVLPAQGLNVYSILQHDTLVMTLGAIRKIEDRLHTPINR